MESKELRVGNFTKDKHGNIFTIIEITSNKTTVSVFDSSTYIKPDTLNIEPIPLTEEWFVRLGGKYNNFSDSPYCRYIIYEVNGDNVSRLKDGGKWEYNLADCDECGRYVEVEYVHQLQNLSFALTGEELTWN